MEYPIVRTSNWLCLSITCLLPTIRYSASAILLDAADAWHQRLTRPHGRAVWGKPEETQMVSLNIGVMKVCAPGERPMVNPHALALSGALLEVTAAAGFSDVDVRLHPCRNKTCICLRVVSPASIKQGQSTGAKRSGLQSV